jgi:hypothetical protein
MPNPCRHSGAKTSPHEFAPIAAGLQIFRLRLIDT